MNLHSALFVKTAARLLAPSDDLAETLLHKLPTGKAALLDYRRPRSVRQHRLMFACLKILVDNADHVEFPFLADIDSALEHLKLACGHVRIMVDATAGKPVYVLKSISFGAMQQDDFQRFFNTAKEVICTRWLPGLAIEVLDREILQMIGEK